MLLLTSKITPNIRKNYHVHKKRIKFVKKIIFFVVILLDFSDTYKNISILSFILLKIIQYPVTGSFHVSLFFHFFNIALHHIFNQGV